MKSNFLVILFLKIRYEIVMVHKFEKLLSIPKSFYVCLKLLGIKKALSLPILVHYNTKIIDLKGCVHILGRPGGG